MDHDQEYQVQEPRDQEPQDQEPQKQKHQHQEPQYQQSKDIKMQVQAAPANAVHVVGLSRVGPKPSMVNCSICQRSVLTKVKHVSTVKTHLWAFCLFIFCCPCMFIPYVTKCCRKADHTCPGCNAFIGSYPEH